MKVRMTVLYGTILAVGITFCILGVFILVQDSVVSDDLEPSTSEYEAEIIALEWFTLEPIEANVSIYKRFMTENPIVFQDMVYGKASTKLECGKSYSVYATHNNQTVSLDPGTTLGGSYLKNDDPDVKILIRVWAIYEKGNFRKNLIELEVEHLD